MQKWTVSILAGIAGIVVGLWFSENLMISKLFLGGVEVDLSDATAVAWALANSSKSEWQTYLVLGQEIVFVLPGSNWTTIVPLAFALLFFSITFFLASLSARQKARPKTPFLKVTPLPDNAQNKKTARLSGETSSGAPLISLEKSNTNGVGHQQVTVKGQPVDFDGSADPEAEESQEAVQEALQEAEPEETAEAAQGEKAETAKEVTARKPAAKKKAAKKATARKPAAKKKVAKERTEEPEPEKTGQPADGAENLEDEVWQTHYDYNDAVRTNFDKLTTRGEHLAIDFAKRFMEDPTESDLEEIVAQVLEEEKKRNRFSDNEKVEAAHAAMKEFSEDAAAEFRRVVDILGEDADLNAITGKIRERFPKADAVSSGLDTRQMSENQIISELRQMGFDIIAPAGGPYTVKNRSGDRITKPVKFFELQEFLTEKRSQCWRNEAEH